MMRKQANSKNSVAEYLECHPFDERRDVVEAATSWIRSRHISGRMRAKQ